MDKRWLALGVLLGVFGLLPTAAAKEPFRASLEELVQRYQTPHDVAAFLHQHFVFRRDPELFGEAEYWQAPEEFLARQAGDCEDFALLAQTLLQRNGIEAYVFSLFGEGGYAHTVCVFKDERGGYNVIDQQRVRHYSARSLEALSSQLCPTWTFGGVMERVGTRGRLVSKLTNPHPRSSLRMLHSLATVQF